MNVPQLLYLACDKFLALADQYRATSTMAQQAADDIELKIAERMRLWLNGLAPSAAQAQLTALAQNFRYVQAETGALSTSLATFGAQMKSYQTALGELIDWGVKQNIAYTDDCSVWYTGPDGKLVYLYPQKGILGHAERDLPDTSTDPLHAPAQEYANLLSDLMDKVNDLDAEWAPQVDKLQADDDLTVTADDWRDSRADTDAVRGDLQGLDVTPPPAHGTPSQNAAWWKSLGPRDQQLYMSVYANDLASMDGLPDGVSAQASRIDYEQHA